NAKHLLGDARRIMEASNAETVRKRGAEAMAALSERQDTLREEEEKKAQKTLENYFKQWKEIETASDPISKIRQSEKVLRDANQHKEALNQYLPVEHQSDFDELIKAVHSALDGDRETQICDLFSKLPEEMKGRVYAKLGELIAARCIVMNGQPETQPIAGNH